MLFADQKWAHLGHASIFDLNELRWCLIAKCSSFVSGSHFLLLSRGEDSLLLPHIFNWGQHGPRGQLGHVFDNLENISRILEIISQFFQNVENISRNFQNLEEYEIYYFK